MSRAELVMGIETEYGLYVRGDFSSQADVAAANTKANEVVRTLIHASPLWMGRNIVISARDGDYPFQYLANGARMYTDVGHPEYSTPECATPREVVAYDVAGERILHDAAQRVADEIGFEVAIVKRLTDGHGHTWGCHENYCVSPQYFSNVTIHEQLTEEQRVLATWFAVRQVLVGAGKIGSDDSRRDTAFQLSQRADFITQFRNNSTMYNRPLIQTRDESHANKEVWRRLHVICGDATKCQWSTYFRLGLTALLVMMSHDGSRRRWPPLPILWKHSSDAHESIMRFISHDADMVARYPVRILHGRNQLGGIRTMSAAEIVSYYVAALAAFVERKSWSSKHERDDYRALVTKASWAVELLMTGRWRALYGWLDWPTKRILVEEYLRLHAKSWNDVLTDDDLFRRVRILGDYSFATLDASSSMHEKLHQIGVIRPLLNSSEIARAMCYPPDGRARIRSELAARYGLYLAHMQWSDATFIQSPIVMRLRLDDPIGSHADGILEAISLCATPLDLCFYLDKHPLPHIAMNIDTRPGGLYARA